MRNIKSILFFLLTVAILLPSKSTSQDSNEFVVTYKIHKVYPHLSIPIQQMEEAKTISDLNKHYKDSWVKEYRSIEIASIQNGKSIRTLSQQEALSPEQKEQIRKADKGSGITVTVKYLPENDLIHNEVKTTDFTFTVDPAIEAKYPGGQEQLNAYIKETTSNKISDEVFDQYNLTAITFAIDEQGNVIEAQVSNTSADKATEDILLESICNMPKWSPASYSNGQLVKQDFVFIVGDSTSCSMNFFHTRPFPLYLK